MSGSTNVFFASRDLRNVANEDELRADGESSEGLGASVIATFSDEVGLGGSSSILARRGEVSILGLAFL